MSHLTTIFRRLIRRTSAYDKSNRISWNCTADREGGLAAFFVERDGIGTTRRYSLFCAPAME